MGLGGQRPLAVGAITLFVADVAAAKAWYQRTFEAPMVFEDDVSAVVKLDNTLVNLLARDVLLD